MRVSVIVATKNRARSFRRLLMSLLQQKRIPDELIVVDASTNSDVKEVIERADTHFEVTYVRQKIGGLPTARNIGVKNSSGDVAVFLDDDVVLDSLYLEEVLATYDQDTKGTLAGVTGVEIGKRHTRTISDRFFRLMRIVFFWDSPRAGTISCIGMLSGLPRTGGYVEAFYGHNMSFKREIFREFEFDENLEVHPLAMGEDVDFSHRVGKEYLLKVNPRAKIKHEGPSSQDYKFASTFYLCSSMMFVRNFYVIMCKNIGKSLHNKMAFLWSVFGLTLGRMMLYLACPSEKRKSSLKGVVSGLKLILNGTLTRPDRCQALAR